jgi:photosystem II stability/assembly factor-like uncharacterized protein
MRSGRSAHRRSTALAAVSLLLAGSLFAQGPAGGPPPLVNVSDDPMLRSFQFRSIGPAVMGGRLDDIEGAINDPFLMYVGFATGGLWKTTNGGRTWTSLFDEMPNSSIGDIAIAPSNSDIVYVGMGEPNNRQSSTIGNGVYKTTDGGKSWTHLGLEDTQSIGRIAVHPTDPNIVFVAAVGHLFGPNEERGLYKSADGGKTWKKAKYVDADTGFTDVAIDPKNPKIVYAASYQRRRTWWGFNGGGSGSGLWKSIDLGETWTKVQGNGWPAPKDGIIGRIGIDIHRSNPAIVYAIVEVGAEAGIQVGVADDGGPAGQGTSTPRNGPDRSGVWRSNDSGKTWTFLTNVNDRPIYYSQIRVDPNNPDKLFQGGAGAQMSTDGGKAWRPVQGTGHGDYHAIWISPKDPRIVAVGHDGGLDISFDGGVSWEYHNNMPLGQFYQVSADMRRPYYVCGGLQDNGSWCGPSAVRSTGGAVNTDWFNVGGGDGFYTRQDPSDYTTVYAESQNGAMSRLDLRNGTNRSVRPNAGPAGGRGGGGGGGRGGAANILNVPAQPAPFRFYWNTPIELSPHNPSIVYTGAQFFFKSTNRGDTWWMNPADLTNNVDRFANPIMGVPGRAPMASKHDGYSTNSVITTIAESPVRAGVIYVGTDDGNLQLSLDGGATFSNVIANVSGAPKGAIQVTRVVPSNFDAATAYVSLDNHRNDDWKPYLFKTTDYGKTWASVAGNLPARGPINAVREDYDNPNLLFVGTEFALFVTLDGGKDWKPFSTGLPSVRIDDLLIHPRDRDLIVATHGRSFYIADDITPLEQLGRAGNANVVLFEPRPAVQWKNDAEATRRVTAKQFRGQNPQGGTALSFWARSDGGDARIEILDGGQVIRTITTTMRAGINRVQWDLQADPSQPATAGGGRGGGGRGGGGAAAGGGGGAAGAAAAGAAGAGGAAAGGGGAGAGAGGAAAGGGAAGGGAAGAGAAGAGAAGEGQPTGGAQFGGRGGGAGRGQVPFVGGGGRGGFGGGGAVVNPGTYIVRLTVGGQTLTTSVVVLEDIWMKK